MNKTSFVVAILLLLLGPVAAMGQVPYIAMEPIDCVPTGGNAVVNAGAAPVLEGQEPRVYFRRQGHGDYYWASMDKADEGVFWGVLPKPEQDNLVAEYYVAVADAAGLIVGQSAVATAPVKADCVVDLTDEQEDRAEDLTIGDTVFGQREYKVAWWECPGIDLRIDSDGEERNDDLCFVGVIWWQRPVVWIPLAAVAAGGIVAIIDDGAPQDASPVVP